MFRLLYSTLFFIFLVAQNWAQTTDIQGSWKGELKSTLGIIDIKIELSEMNGQLVGTLTSEKSGISRMVLDTVIFEENRLKFKLNIAQAKYEASFRDSKFEGVWYQGAFDLPLILVSEKEFVSSVSIPTRKQTPIAPFHYLTEDVIFHNKIDNIKLAGTLTIPEGKGPFSAVILLSVAGANDRDMSHSAGHKPFLVVADYLTNHGIAVLRYDDRGTGNSEGNLFQSDFDNFSKDAIAAIEFLKGNERIDPKKIGFIGHSEGTIIAPKVAILENSNVAFIVMLGAAGIPLDKLTENRLNRMKTKYDLSSFEKEEMLTYMKKVQDIIRTTTDKTKIYEQLNQLKAKNTFDKPDFPTQLYMLPKDKEQRIQFFMTPWYKSQVSYDPEKYLTKLDIPILVITGSLDQLQTPETNLPPIVKYLSVAPTDDFKIILVPKVNHLMQTAVTGSPLEYAKIEETFSPKVLKLIKEWISER